MTFAGFPYPICALKPEKRSDIFIFYQKIVTKHGANHAGLI
jgi:hypothetical protein